MKTAFHAIALAQSVMPAAAARFVLKRAAGRRPSIPPISAKRYGTIWEAVKDSPRLQQQAAFIAALDERGYCPFAKPLHRLP